jgi:glycolate oxidase iron-sulfur subunit
MHIELHPKFADTTEGTRARELTSACVHCGFCLATCPTYLDNRDERDSPRGRIYLIKQLLENGTAGDATRAHLDRCLTCRSCETTCPSGVQYSQLLDIGRGLIEDHAPRGVLQRAYRRALRFVLTSRRVFAVLLSLGRLVRPILPAGLATRIPPKQALRPLPDKATSTRIALLLEGCVQEASTPRTNNAARRVLARLGVNLVSVPAAGCCGAVNYHLGAQQDGLDDLRRNIDAWWPRVEDGVEAILSSATGCGVMLADYGHLLAHDPAYAERAAVIAGLAEDVGHFLARQDLAGLDFDRQVGPVAVHTPCTLYHGMGEPALVENLLQQLGFEVVPAAESHLCCGSAGTYSLLQPATSRRLRKWKLAALRAGEPALIATANVGCQLHLAETAEIPVVHWLELLDNAPPPTREND